MSGSSLKENSLRMKSIVIAIMRYLLNLKRPSKAANTRLLQQRGERLDSLLIREAVDGDLPALAALHVKTWIGTYLNVKHPPTYEIREYQWKEQFQVRDGSWFCFVIVNASGELVGFAKGKREPNGKGGLNKIYLLREYQRLGLGRLLLCHVARRFNCFHPQNPGFLINGSRISGSHYQNCHRVLRPPILYRSLSTSH